MWMAAWCSPENTLRKGLVNFAALKPCGNNYFVIYSVFKEPDTFLSNGNLEGLFEVFLTDFDTQ